ncbi:MAG: hypothetical protein KKB50_03140 [Planctomycetes bacterium]|nr:hypothetical protein [Planctomycetota bacterium]
MSETIKCACSHCGAKYRLPVEAQGRSARCKKCGEKFKVPRAESLEDSVLSWLADPEAEQEESAARPRVISMGAGDVPAVEGTAPKRGRGPIRMKSESTESK